MNQNQLSRYGSRYNNHQQNKQKKSKSISYNKVQILHIIENLWIDFEKTTIPLLKSVQERNCFPYY